MMRVLIIGKSGFVAKSLNEFFSEKREIELEMAGHKELNLLDEKMVNTFFEGKYYEVVINCAVWSSINAAYWDKNLEVEKDLRMFVHLANNSMHMGKLINFGSGAEFDKSKSIVSASEDEKGHNVPQSAYGFAKYVINRLIEQSSNMYNLRIFGLYGKYEDYRYKFITGACCKAIKGVPISIRRNVVFDYLYIDDFCEMLYRFIKLEEPKYHSYNITSGRQTDLLTLAHTVSGISCKDIPIYVCNDGLGNEYTGSNVRIISEIGKVEFTPFEKAIETIYKYYEENINLIDIEALLYQ